MARFRQPGAAAIAFMNTLAATEARFSARARSARRPCKASAMPRQAKTSAAASGMAASRAATTGRWRVASTIRYWAVKLTAAAAAARTHRPAAALRSHRPERSLDHLGGTGWLPGPGGGATGPAMITTRPEAGRWPVMSRPVRALGNVTAGIATVMSDRLPGQESGSWSLPGPASGVRTPTPIRRRVIAPMRVRGALVRLMCRSSSWMPTSTRTSSARTPSAIRSATMAMAMATGSVVLAMSGIGHHSLRGGGDRLHHGA